MPEGRSTEDQVHIDDIDRSDRSYQFDTLKVVKSVQTGRLYYAEDSGCSCPCPFEDEDNDFPRAWTPIVEGDSFNAFATHVRSWALDEEYHRENITASEVEKFIEEVKKHLKIEGY